MQKLKETTTFVLVIVGTLALIMFLISLKMAHTDAQNHQKFEAWKRLNGKPDASFDDWKTLNP